jgi:XTP/dITP diphosphohydrolase
MTLYVCSGNVGKQREFEIAAREIFLGWSIKIQPLPDLRDIPAPEETGFTFEENASLKALYYCGFTTELVLADDSGLEVDALGGAPGVYSARYAGPGATDEDNNNALLRALKNSAIRTARFVCVIALARRGRLLLTARGTVEGVILSAPRGNGGFGYDPLFFYPPLGRSFAELSPDEKLAISHRGKALRSALSSLMAMNLG